MMLKRIIINREILKSIFVMIMVVTLLSVSFAWLYDEYIGSGANLRIGEIAHNVTIYDKDGNVLNSNQDLYTLIEESNLSNTSQNSMFIKIENTGTIDLEYGLTFTLDGDLDPAGILYYRLFEVTNEVNGTNQGSYDSKLMSYAHQNPLDGNIEFGTTNPISNMTLINNYIEIGDIKKTNSGDDFVIYRFDYGMYQNVNTSIYQNKQLSVHMNLYSSQIGTITAENSSGLTYEVQTEAQLRDVLNQAVSNDTIMLINDINISGTLNIPRRINLNLNGYTLDISEDLVYEFVNTGDLTINATGTSRLIVGNDFYLNTPKANVTIKGANKNYDIVVGGEFNVNANLSDEDDGCYFENVRIVKSRSSLIPVDLLVKSNTKILIGTDVTLGIIKASLNSTNIEVINNGNITQINFSEMNLLETFTKYQIYVYNLGEIYGVLGSTGIILPSTSTPYIEDGNGNTLIIKGITSGDITVSGSPNYTAGNITNNTEDITVVPITDEENSYIVYIKDSTVSVEGLLAQYFIDQSFTEPYTKISQIKKLIIYTLNAQYLENEDFDFLKSNLIPELEHLNISNSRVIDGTSINEIKPYAMAGKTTLKTLKLPKTVTRIGAYAFNNCPLGEIPADGEFSFLSIPQTVNYIGQYAFNTSKYVEILGVVPPTINSTAFNITDNGSKFFVTDGTIESYQQSPAINEKNVFVISKLSDNRNYFVYNKNQGLGISYNINNYLSASILGVPNLITYNGSNLNVLEIGPNAYRSLNIVNSDGASIQLPNILTNIRDYAFYGLNINQAGLTNVLEIGNYAFYNTELTELIANNLVSIGDYAFSNNVIKRISLLDISSIGNNAFHNNPNLYEMDLGEVDYIGDFAFSNCPNLLKVYLKNTTSLFINNSEEIDITLGNNAIDNTWGSYSDNRLRIYVPDGVSSTGSSYLALYKKLISNYANYIYVIGGEYGSYTHMGVNYQINEYTLKDITLTNRLGNSVNGYEIISYQGRDLDSNYVIPSTLELNGVTKNVISIGENAYRNVLVSESNEVSLINNNIINVDAYAFYGVSLYEFSGNNILSVGNGAFANSTLKTSKMPNLNTLGNDAYKNNTNLVMINLGNVSSIGEDALKDCVNLQQLFITNTSNAITLTGEPFTNMGSLTDHRIRIYVPEGNVSYYKNLFSSFSNYIYNTGTIVGNYTGNLGYDIGEFSVREVTIENKDGNNITGYEIIEYHGADIDGTYNIPGEVTLPGGTMNIISIGDNAYLNSFYATNTAIDIVNNSILKIGSASFKNSNGIRHVTLPNCLSIGNNAFDNSSITIGTFVNIDRIGDYAFSNAHTLYKLDLGVITKTGFHSISNNPKLYVINFNVDSLELQFDAETFYNVGYETNERMRFYVTNGKNSDGERYVDIYKNQINTNYQSYFFAYDLMFGEFYPTDIPEEINIGQYSIRDITLKDENNNNVSGYEFVEYHGADTTDYYEFPTEIMLSDATLSGTIGPAQNTYGSEGSWTSEYDISITNNGSESIDSWRVVIDTEAGGTVTQVNAYTSIVTINQKSITLTNANYNGTIAPGQTLVTRIQMTRQVLNFTPVVKVVKTNTIALDAIPIISIGDSAFEHASSVTNLAFDINGSNLLTIGKGAFKSFAGVRSIDAPKVLTIGEQAFMEATLLKRAEFKKLTTVGSFAFQDARELAYLNLGYISVLPEGLLQRTYKMTQVFFYNVNTLPDTEEMNMTILENALTNMGTTAGSRLRIYVPKGSNPNGYSFVKSYKNTFPDSYAPYIYEMGNIVGSFENTDTGLETGEYTVKEITINGVRGWQIIDYHGANIDGNFVFPDTLVYGDDTLPVISIGPNAFYFVIVDEEYEWYLEIPDSIKEIGDYAFYQRDIISVSINTINSIGRYAFANNDDLLSVSINSVRLINPYAFYLNVNMATVSLGTGVEEIGDFAFYNSWSENSFQTLYIETEDPPIIYANTLPSLYWSGGDTMPTIYVPDLYIDDYLDDELWSLYTIKRIGSVYANQYIYSIINDNEVEIVGFIDHRTQNIYIPSQFYLNSGTYRVTSISRDAFDSVSSLRMVQLPQYINNLENGFLANNASVREINVVGSNTYFKGTDGVLFDKNGEVLIRYPRGKTTRNYVVPYGTKVISYNAFLNCTNLQTIEFNSDLLTISVDAFTGSRNITSFKFTGATPPYFTGFGAIPFNRNLSVIYPSQYANLYNSKVYYRLYYNYFTTY